MTGRHRGKHLGSAITQTLREEILRLVRIRYGDFGPTLAKKRYERDGHRLSGETLRRWTIADGLRQLREL